MAKIKYVTKWLIVVGYFFGLIGFIVTFRTTILAFINGKIIGAFQVLVKINEYGEAQFEVILLTFGLLLVLSGFIALIISFEEGWKNFLKEAKKAIAGLRKEKKSEMEFYLSAMQWTKVEELNIDCENDFLIEKQKINETLNILEGKWESNEITKENYDKVTGYLTQQNGLLNYKYMLFVQDRAHEDFRDQIEQLKNGILLLTQDGFMGIIEDFFKKNNYTFLTIPQDLHEKGFRLAEYVQQEGIQQIFGNRILIYGLHYHDDCIGPETVKKIFQQAKSFDADCGYMITSSNLSDDAKKEFLKNLIIRSEYWSLMTFITRYYLSFYNDPFAELEMKEFERTIK